MNAQCISCHTPLRWPPRRNCSTRDPHYAWQRDRPLTGLGAMAWDLANAAQVYDETRGVER